MSETKDSTIKLFGKTIPVPETLVGVSQADVVNESIDQNHFSSTNSSKESLNNRDEQEVEIEKDTLREMQIHEKNEDEVPTQSTEEFTNPDAASRTGEESVTISTEREVATLKSSKTEEEQDEASNSQDKSLKKTRQNTSMSAL